MLPLSLLAKLFSSEQEIEYLPPEFRAQRVLNEARIPEITNYILQNRNNYVFSSLSASINGNIKFTPNSELSELGTLSVPMDTTFLLNDGQHRKAAIIRALAEDKTLEKETISVVFFKDEGIERAQQMFTDLNKHAVKTSKSLSTLYDNRNELAKATYEIIKSNPFFKNYTDLEKDNLGKNSSNFFTLANLYNANKLIMKTEKCNTKDKAFLKNFWNEICNNITEWQEVMNKEITKKDLRENYILTLGITISSFGRLGRYFFENKNIDIKSKLNKLKKINWKRNNEKDWLNRTIGTNGRIINNETSIMLTCSRIKQLIGIPLNKEEQEKEASLEKINNAD